MPNYPKEKLKHFKTNYNKFFPINGTKDIVYLYIYLAMIVIMECIIYLNTISHFDPFQPSVSFHTETSHLFCVTKQMTGFYMKCNTKPK